VHGETARRRRRFWVVVGAVAVVLVAGTGAAVHHVTSEAPFREHVAELRAQGVPTTVEEVLAAGPPPEENGADELLAALAWLDEHHPEPWDVTGPWDYTAKFPWEETATPEQMEALAGFLEEVEPFFDRVSAALEKPRLWFGAPATDESWGLSHDHVSEIMRVSRVLSARAVAAKEPDDRLEAIEDLLALGRKMEAVDLTDFMVAVANKGAGLHSLREGLAAGTLEAVPAQMSLEPVLAAPRVTSWRAGISGERSYLLIAYDALLDGKIPTPSLLDELQARLRGRKAFEHGTPRDAVRWSKATAQVAAVPEGLPFAERLARTEATDTDEDPLLLYGPILRRWVRNEATSRLARVALAAAAHRAETGSWPASLAELEPLLQGGLPMDPFTQKDFVMEPVPGGGLRLRAAFPADFTADDQEGLVWELPGTR